MLTLIFLMAFWFGLAKFFAPMVKVFDWCINAIAPLVKFMSKITGWSGPRHAYIFLTLSILCDFIGEFNSTPEYGANIHFVMVGLWVWACSWGIEKMHKISTTPPDETMPVTPQAFSSLLNMSMWILFIMPLSIYLEVGDSNNIIGTVAGYWEHGLDGMVVLTAWVWTPPGKSLYARVKEKIKSLSWSPKPVLAPVPQ